MKLIVSISTLVLAASLADAQVVVIDPTAIARNQANQAVNLAKYVQMINNQVQQINTLPRSESACSLQDRPKASIFRRFCKGRASRD